MKYGSWSVQVTFNANGAAASTFTNMPAASTFLFNSHRHVTMIGTHGLNRVRLKVNKQATAGASGAVLELRYATAFSTAVGNYSQLGVTPVSVAVNVTNTYLDTGWIDLSDDVKSADEVYLAVVGSGGDGVLDPAFGTIAASFD